MDIENFDVKLGVETGKKGSTVGINSGQVSYRNTENVNRDKIVIYLKGSLCILICLLCRFTDLSMLIWSHPRIYNIHKEK